MAIHGDARAIDAIASLADPAVPIEIIVVNTGSGSLRDGLGAMLDHVVLVESSVLRLPGGTRNLGIAAARGPIVAFLAADCLASPGWAARRIAAHRRSEAVASAILPAPAADGSVSPVSLAVHLHMYSRRDPDCPGHRAVRYGVSYHRDSFARHGTFLDDCLVGEDSEFNERLPAPPAWEPDIVTVHHNPTGLVVALVDAWQRGARLRQWMSSQSAHPTYRALLWSYGAAADAMSVLPHVRPERRGGLLAALPLVWCLTLVRIGGVLSQAARRRSVTAG